MTTDASALPRPPANVGPLEVVVVASAAGGIRALTHLLGALPGDFPAAVVVVQHLSPHHPSLLARILGKATALEVREACAGDVLRPGVVFLAPPDRHLLIEPGGALALSGAPPVHFSRPAADCLFASAAASFPGRVAAVVLTGLGRDGADGVRAVKHAGGAVFVQDEASSEFNAMPRAAILTGEADQILPLDAIAPALVTLARRDRQP